MRDSVPKNAANAVDKAFCHKNFTIFNCEDTKNGCIIDKNGTILTSAHVVDVAKNVVVTMYNGQDYKGRVVKHFDGGKDIALIKIDVPMELKTVKLGNSEKIKVGQKVFAIGNPFGFNSLFLKIRNKNLVFDSCAFCRFEHFAQNQRISTRFILNNEHNGHFFDWLCTIPKDYISPVDVVEQISIVFVLIIVGYILTRLNN